MTNVMDMTDVMDTTNVMDMNGLMVWVGGQKQTATEKAYQVGCEWGWLVGYGVLTALVGSLVYRYRRYMRRNLVLLGFTFLFVLLLQFWLQMPKPMQRRAYWDDWCVLGLLVSSYMLLVVPRLCLLLGYSVFKDTVNVIDWSGTHQGKGVLYASFFLATMVTGHMHHQNVVFDGWLRNRQICTRDDWCAFFLCQPFLKVVYADIYCNVVAYASTLSVFAFAHFDSELAKVEVPPTLAVWWQSVHEPFVTMIQQDRQSSNDRARLQIGNAVTQVTAWAVQNPTFALVAGGMTSGFSVYMQRLEYMNTLRMAELLVLLLGVTWLLYILALWWHMSSRQLGAAIARQLQMSLKFICVGFIIITCIRECMLIPVGIMCFVYVWPLQRLREKDEVRIITCLALWFWALYLFWCWYQWDIRNSLWHKLYTWLN